MGQFTSRSRVVHVRPMLADQETGNKALRRLGHKRHRKTPANQVMGPVLLLAAFIGNLNQQYRKLGVFGLLLWLHSITLNFMYDAYEAYKMYGYLWVSVRGVEWLVCCAGSWALIRRTLPWLQKGLLQLEEENIYRKTLKKMAEKTKNLPYLLLCFAVAAGSLQYGIMRIDKASHVDFGQHVPTAGLVFLHALRFASGVHIFYAIGLFWAVPVYVMLMAGYSMMEFQDQIRSRLRKKNGCDLLSFREAVTSFNERVKFARESSAACKSILVVLLIASLISLVVNAYVFLFTTRYFLYIMHALLPLALAAYPLRLASWVTHQYHWYLLVVVRSWVERPDESTESDSENDPPAKRTSVTQRPRAKTASAADYKHQRAQVGPPMTIHLPDLGHVHVNQLRPGTARDNTERLKSVLVSSARIVGKLQHNRKQTKFNFEKYISYLEKVSKGTGFSIFGMIVTWDLVSSLFFVVISVVALFVQESIFGNAKSML